MHIARHTRHWGHGQLENLLGSCAGAYTMISRFYFIRFLLLELSNLKFSTSLISNIHSRNMSNKSQSEQKTYHKKATGAALATVKKHAKDHELKLIGSCFW